MTVATRAQPGDVAVEAEPLALLSESSLAIEEHPERFMALLQHATIEQLRPHAPRLLELLRVRTFGLERLDRVTPREVAVQAVLRVGYPFALQLEPEDVAFVREQAATVRRSRRRALLLRVLPVVGVLTMGVVAAAARSGAGQGLEEVAALQAPVVRQTRVLVPPEPEKLLPVPAVKDLVLDDERAELLTSLMERLGDLRKDEKALAVGVDCLGDGLSDEAACATELATILKRLSARTRTNTAELRRAADTLAQFADSPRSPALRRQARASLAVIDRFAARDAPSSEDVGNKVRIAVDAFSEGEFQRALSAAWGCLIVNDQQVECLRVAAAAELLTKGGSQHLGITLQDSIDTFDFLRRQLAAVDSRARRDQCQSQSPGTDESRPIACP